MEALERAKIVLREHIIANKSKVKADLEELRKLSEGYDIYNYLDNASESLSMDSVEVVEGTYSDIANLIDCDIFSYNVVFTSNYDSEYPPPDYSELIAPKKDFDFYQGLFF